MDYEETIVITVDVSVGRGMWKAHATVKLCACPHVGDTIEAHDITVNCDRVHITDDRVYVEENRVFESALDAEMYFK